MVLEHNTIPFNNRDLFKNSKFLLSKFLKHLNLNITLKTYNQDRYEKS